MGFGFVFFLSAYKSFGRESRSLSLSDCHSNPSCASCVAWCDLWQATKSLCASVFREVIPTCTPGLVPALLTVRVVEATCWQKPTQGKHR